MFFKNLPFISAGLLQIVVAIQDTKVLLVVAPRFVIVITVVVVAMPELAVVVEVVAIIGFAVDTIE